MLVEAVTKPIRYRLTDGQEIHLRLGVPADIPDQQAQALLLKAGDRVRLVPAEGSTKIEPATCRRPVYWESGDSGRIVGPGHVTHMTQVMDGNGQETFWLCVEYQGSWRWIREDLLRSAKEAR
ncbi:hypothetical protein YTPLAS18_16960 [Nitrospira sp.]|nr:hypothetical protein YTPLAS18_16960 [Nitrospira sp.]